MLLHRQEFMCTLRDNIAHHRLGPADQIPVDRLGPRDPEARMGSGLKPASSQLSYQMPGINRKRTFVAYSPYPVRPSFNISSSRWVR